MEGMAGGGTPVEPHPGRPRPPTPPSHPSPHLVRQLARVADDEGAHLAVHRLELLQDGEDKDRGLAHARLGLAEDVHAQDGLRDALMLHWGGWGGGRVAGGAGRTAASAPPRRSPSRPPPSDGCSNPQSTMARSSSGLSRKSLKPEEWMPTYPFLTGAAAAPASPPARAPASSSS